MTAAAAKIETATLPKGSAVRYVGDHEPVWYGWMGTIAGRTCPTRYRVLLTRPDGRQMGIVCAASDVEAVA
jgi:hypothetical protein